MISFSIATTVKDLPSTILDITEKQTLAELYWAKYKFDEAYKKAKESAVLAKYALARIKN